MKLSELKTADQVNEERRRADPEFRAAWDASAFSRAVAVAIVRYRTERGWSQRQMADATGIAQPQIARLELGEHEPRFGTLVRLTAGTGLRLHFDVKDGDVAVDVPRSSRVRRVPHRRPVSA